MANPEQHMQEWYAMWLRLQNVLFCASAGGMRTSMTTGIKMKKAGYQKGFPDMIILEPRAGWHGMFAELKVKTKPSKEQELWERDLREHGYFAVIMPRNLEYGEACYWLEDITSRYLKGAIPCPED